MNRVVTMEMYPDGDTQIQVFYVEDDLVDPMLSILDSTKTNYKSQVVADILVEDGDDWLPVGWSNLRDGNV